MVCHCSNFLQNSVWSNIPRGQFSLYLKSSGSSNRRYLEIREISWVKTYFPSFLVRIALLSGLGCFSFSRISATLYSASFMSAGPTRARSPTSDHIRGVLHFLPKRASNGDIPKLAWYPLLYENSA